MCSLCHQDRDDKLIIFICYNMGKSESFILFTKYLHRYAEKPCSYTQHLYVELTYCRLVSKVLQVTLYYDYDYDAISEATLLLQNR